MITLPAYNDIQLSLDSGRHKLATISNSSGSSTAGNSFILCKLEHCTIHTAPHTQV